MKNHLAPGGILARGPSRILRWALGALLSGVSIPSNASTAAVSASSGSDAQPDFQQPQEIIVTGRSLFPDLRPERELDESGITSYGVSTIDELLTDIQSELGDDEEPLILVNGERLNDTNGIAGIPVEAVQNIQVLPRGSAVRVGGRSGQRVISLTMKRKVRSATVTAAPKISTDGDSRGARGELIFTHVRGPTRANLGLRARGESSLLESESHIIEPTPRLPYALVGNIVGYPSTSSEIDPLLSLLAGRTVTVAPVPAGSSRSLSDFAAGANNAAFTNIGDFRTLRPSNRNYDVSGTVSTKLSPWLSSTATVRLNRIVSRSLRGLPAALFRLTPDNDFSPFSREVAVAAYGPRPLRSEAKRDSGQGSVELHAHFGKWNANLAAGHDQSTDRSEFQRQTGSSTILLDPTFDPFGGDLGTLIKVGTSSTRSRTVTNRVETSATGPALKLPAGDVVATVEGRLSWYRLHSESSFSTGSNRNLSNSERSVRGALEIPIASRTNDFLSQIGDVSATLEYGRLHSSQAGGLTNYSYGLTWEPLQALRLRGAIEQTEVAPIIDYLGAPVIETPAVRTFDPLTGQTVDVTQISGGNPGLRSERDQVRRLSALVRLVPRLSLQLNAEYTDTDRRNFVSYLPEASVAIILAFPDRFIRDSGGALSTVDLRPVNFASDREKRMRWGLSLNTRLWTPKPNASAQSRLHSSAKRSPPILELTANHTVVFSDRILIRSGLDPVDLLSGGAIGIGGGRLRHQVDGTAAVTSNGTGARLGVTWRGASSLVSRAAGATDTLHFSPLLVLNLRAFTDVHRLLPHSSWTKSLRLSLDAVNLLNQRQRVRDSAGTTPLQYQPGYRDPLGRTIELEIRKVF